MAIGPEEWIAAGARMLGDGGWEKVKVEPLARMLGVTKGSFYWHFGSRRELLGAIVEAWEEESTLAVARYVDRNASNAEERLRLLWSLRDDGHLETELAIRDLATRDDEVLVVVERVDTARLGYLRRNFRDLGLSAAETEVRSMLFYSLLIGDHFVADAHGRYARKTVLDGAIDFLLRPTA
ncbi:MAG: TetR/AcrR family transcriptional regulator [Myxococcota bacterium]